MPQENGSGGPRGGGRGRDGGTPGQGPRREGGFGGREGGRGRGGRDGRRGEGREEGFGPGQRVITELSVLEKALSKSDFAAQKVPLESIVRALRPMRLKALEDLDLNTRGRLITTLLRVQRQTKPPQPEGWSPPWAAQPAPAAEAAPAPAPVEAPAAEAAPEEPAEAAPAEPSGEAAAPQAQDDSAQQKFIGYTDVMLLVGRAWRAAGDRERAEAAFALSGRPAPAEREEPARAEGAERKERGERPERGERRERGERPERGERGERPERAPRPERGERPPRGERPARAEGARGERERQPMPELTGDWQEQAKQLESMGRTRDAGRLHERNNSFAEALRLFEAGGDLKSALRNALAGNDATAARRLLGTLPPDQVAPTLEKAGAYELLMEHYVGKGDFENVARLYERARQFDQAALAFERAGKLTLARKSYERARDMASANRIRDLEVKALVERGDRLGAATLLAAAGRGRDAVEVLSPLPPPKAFHFMQRLKLDEEAKDLARRELARAEAENKPAGRARWLELLGEAAAAAEAWEAAGRKEKALPLHEQLGNLARAAQLAEELQQRDKAVDLYTRLGDAAGVERAKALPEAPPPKAAAAEPGEQPSAEESSAPSVSEQESQ
ncbi:DEAD/DEAH box helicase [Myxococcaceae bacterium GXIMD 01537]